MLLLIAAIVWTLAVALLLTRAVRQYGHYEVLRPESALPDATPMPPLSVIVPARNEASHLRQCIESLRAQAYPGGRFNLVIVDDRSTDATGAIAREMAAADRRVRVIDADPLPTNWTGKAHACWQGAQSAGDAEWVCFIDADTTAEPLLLQTAVREATRRGLGLLSLGPAQELGSAWERLILPAGFFLIAFTQDVRAANDPDNFAVHANGQFLLVRRAAYEKVGGFAAVASNVHEDSALARLLKLHGNRVGLLGAEGLLRVRMYESLPSLWEGLTRQAVGLLQSAPLILAWTIGAVLLGWAGVILPALAIWNLVRVGVHPAPLAALVVVLAGSLALLGTHVGAARYFHIPLYYGILFPLSYTLGAGILLTAARQRHRREIRWKGRTYPEADPPAPDAESPRNRAEKEAASP